MLAKQTLLSASLVAALWGGSGEVHADPAPDAVEPGDPPGPPAPAVPPGTPTGTFELGAGYATDDGFLAMMAVSQPHLFRTDLQLSMVARLSERRQLFLTRFVAPDLAGTRWSFGADLYNDTRQLPGFSRQAAGATLQLAHPLGEHLRGFVGWRIEDLQVTPDVAVRGVTPPVPAGSGTVSALRAGLVYSTLDEPFLPRRGGAFAFTVETADRALGSELTYTRIDTRAQAHHPIGPLTLHVGTSASAIAAAGGVPLSQRAFLDGSSDLRGYAPGALLAGGGDLELTGRASLEAPLVPRLGLSAEGFLDVAGVYDTRARLGATGSSAGFGLIWRSPLGPLRFDWAFPLDGGGPRFVVGIGF